LLKESLLHKRVYIDAKARKDIAIALYNIKIESLLGLISLKEKQGNIKLVVSHLL